MRKGWVHICHPDADVDVSLRMNGGDPIAVKVRGCEHHGDRPIHKADLTGINLTEYARTARYFTSGILTRPRTTRKPYRGSPEHTAQVLQAMHDADERGITRATFIADRFGVTRQTAHNWMRLALTDTTKKETRK